MHFHRNFSEAFYERLEDYLSTLDENIVPSQINVFFYTPGICHIIDHLFEIQICMKVYSKLSERTHFRKVFYD